MLKRYVFRLVQNKVTDSALVASFGNDFQMWGAGTLKCGAITSFICGMMRSFLAAERRVPVETYCQKITKVFLFNRLLYFVCKQRHLIVDALADRKPRKSLEDR